MLVFPLERKALVPQKSWSRGGAGAAPVGSRQTQPPDDGASTAVLVMGQPHFQSLLYESAQLVYEKSPEKKRTRCSYFFSEFVILGALLLQADAAQSSCPPCTESASDLLFSSSSGPYPCIPVCQGFRKMGLPYMYLSYWELAPVPEMSLTGLILPEEAFYPVEIST